MSIDEETENTGFTQTPHRADWTGYDNPSTAIVEAVATVVGTDQTDLDPLYEYVEVDALNALLRRDSQVGITFKYGDTIVHTDSTGQIAVRQE